MTDIKSIIESEINNLKQVLTSEINDPLERESVIRMTNDLARLPVRMMAGEDVSLLLASLKAEAAMKGVRVALRSQAAVQQAWMNIITKVLTAAITAAI